MNKKLFFESLLCEQVTLHSLLVVLKVKVGCTPPYISLTECEASQRRLTMDSTSMAGFTLLDFETSTGSQPADENIRVEGGKAEVEPGTVIPIGLDSVATFMELALNVEGAEKAEVIFFDIEDNQLSVEEVSQLSYQFYINGSDELLFLSFCAFSTFSFLWLISSLFLDLKSIFMVACMYMYQPWRW